MKLKRAIREAREVYALLDPGYGYEPDENWIDQTNRLPPLAIRISKETATRMVDQQSNLRILWLPTWRTWREFDRLVLLPPEEV